MKELIEYVARSLVEHPDEVVVEERTSGYRVVYHLTVNEEDMGRVIGKQGRIAQALRTLLKVAATRTGQRVSLEIGD
ncbi:MAG TPA: KH domain-containing protein [Dehalococcoidia bacterium]|nr:KH domain-containing protein [Dehalococcoidia bacterium]